MLESSFAAFFCFFGKYPNPLKYLAAVDSAELYYKDVCQYLKKLYLIFWTKC